MARDFQSSLDDLAREADLDDFRKELANAKEIDLPRNIEEMVDPTGEYARSMEDVENSVESSLTEEPQTAPDAKPADTQESDLGTGHETPAKTAGA